MRNKGGHYMTLIKKEFLMILSFLSGIAVFFMTSAFQSMAYWGNDSTWYWIGASFTYLLGVVGVVLLAFSIKKEKREKGESKFSLSVFGLVTSILLICGFLWTTFIIIGGLSGI